MPELDFENKLYNHIKVLTDETIRWREAEDFDKEIDNLEKRFKAMRSIRGLDYNDLPKTNPWPGCSDIGIPIDAITIQSIVARVDRVEFERMPLTRVMPVDEQTDLASAKKIEPFLDWQKINLMRIRTPKLMATRKALTVGSYFWKAVFEEEYVYTDEDIFGLRDPDTNEILKDDNGDPVEWDPEGDPPLNDSLHAYQVMPLKRTAKRDTYRGPKVYGRDPRQILWPKDETSYDPNDWDWWSDLYERSLEWLEDKGKEIGWKNIDKILARVSASAVEHGITVDKKKLVKLREWYGRFEINGKLRWIVAVIAPEYSVFLGWELDKVREKSGDTRLIHRCPIPMEGQVRGMSISEFIKGLRDAIDVTVNQDFDRGSRTNNPPIIYSHGSGFDPAKHNFGYRFWPEKIPGTIRELPMQTHSQELQKVELLLGLVQRLFGVTDTTSGVENPNNKTYGGISTLLAEGNVNINMLIQSLNESNIRLDEMIIALNSIYIRRDEEGNAIPITVPVLDDFSSVMNDPENPFLTITEDELIGRYNFMPTGADLNINTRTMREEAGFLFEKVMQFAQVNPFLQDLNVIREATADVFKAFGKKNIKIPSVEEIQMKMQQQAQQAMQMQQQQEQAKAQQEQDKAQTDIKGKMALEAMKGASRGKR